ncbi:DoxX family protein [uncultured Kordia sp.]|uniref:DoxX family protein n=1 Tax=uncultured Kordia sp. TaxID=507699 RepID=UPI0026296633|nr:DoxX family protein [uncultured Kordia sp.]
MNAQKKEQYHHIGLLLLRITIGILILFHGIANLTSNYAFIKQVLQGYHIPSFLAYGVFVGEIIAPILIIIGYKVRGSGLIIAFNFLVAILLAHSSDIFALNQFGGWAIELQVVYLFGAITLFFTGAGNYALSTDSKWD